MFCSKCGSILVNKKGKLVCGSCGAESKDGKIKEDTKKTVKSEKSVAVMKEDPEIHPKTKEECPKCKNEEAFYWMVQTRSADESPTKFFKCTKCSHIWRDYS